MSYFTMTRLVLKWAFQKPPTRHYPFEPRHVIAGSRGQLTFDPATCVYCGVCVKKCPPKAIQVHRAQKKWSIDRLMCISCGYCVEACPKKSLALSTSHGVSLVTKDRELHDALTQSLGAA